MRTPPFLLGAALLFWGWQTGFLVVGLLMAVALESAHWIKARWEVSDDDFRRLWAFCSVLLLAAVVYAFTANRGPADFLGFFQNPNLSTSRNAGDASARTAAAFLRWLPMVFFLLVGAQAFSSREGVPLEAISVIVRRRRKRARESGQPLPASRSVNVSYAYFGLCLFGAAIHPSENSTFFWGLSGLLAWALWPRRSRRFGVAIWAGALAAAIALGYGAQVGVGPLQRYLEGVNAGWLSRFARRGFDPSRSRTTLGQIGRAKASGKIVIRLEPKANQAPPALLREASYRAYRAQTWYAGAADAAFKEGFVAQPDGTTWLLLPQKTNTAAVTVACYLAGGSALLPLPEGTAQLENLPAFTLQKNGLGAVLAQGPGLVMFDARYGAGGTIDSAANTNEDLSVPVREEPALRQVISELHLEGQNQQQALRTLSGFFQANVGYRTWQEQDAVGSAQETPLGRFLLRDRNGHCEYFATATVLLLRQLGIPARYAVGYAVHEAAGRKYVVRQRDAHAWCLVWNEQNGTWETFDTTPASWVEAEAKRGALFQFLSDLWSRIAFEISRIRWGQTHLRQYLLWALVPILALLLARILFRVRRRPHRRKGEAVLAPTWPGLDSEFYQLERKLVERGVPRRPSEPLSAWLRRAAANPALAEFRGQFEGLLSLHYRYRFDPHGLAPADRETLRREAQLCLASIQGSVALVSSC